MFKMRLTLDPDDWADRAKRNARAVVQVAIQDMCDEIVAKWTGWKVETGFSRASWFLSLHAPATSEPGSGAAGYNVEVLSRFELGDTLYFANTAVYSARLELGFTGTDSLGRTYDQRGHFIVRDVVNRADAIFADAAARVANGDAGPANRWE